MFLTKDGEALPVKHSACALARSRCRHYHLDGEQPAQQHPQEPSSPPFIKSLGVAVRMKLKIHFGLRMRFHGVEGSPGMHKALGWAWRQMPVIPALRWWIQEDRKFKVILGYTEVLRTASAVETMSSS